MTEQKTNFRPSTGKKRVLVVEDELINLEILQLNLSETYDLLTATTGAEALELVRGQYETLSLVLLDLNLPDMHGLEVLRRLKADARYARLPVIVMTAENSAEV